MFSVARCDPISQSVLLEDNMTDSLVAPVTWIGRSWNYCEYCKINYCITKLSRRLHYAEVADKDLRRLQRLTDNISGGDFKRLKPCYHKTLAKLFTSTALLDSPLGKTSQKNLIKLGSVLKVSPT
ncbi:MAG: hypothetical protein ACQEP8_06410 [Chlamydiota bacterium]